MVSKIGWLNHFMFVNYVSLCMSRIYLNQIFKKKWKPDKQTKNITEPRNMTYRIVHPYILSYSSNISCIFLISNWKINSYQKIRKFILPRYHFNWKNNSMNILYIRDNMNWKKNQYIKKKVQLRDKFLHYLLKITWNDLIRTYLILINCYKLIWHNLYKLNLPSTNMYSNKFNKVYFSQFLTFIW